VPQIGQAPDATSFLSTSAILVGVFVTIVGTALAQLLLVSNDQPRTGWGRRAKFVVMAIIVAVDMLGVGFPLIVLYMNTVGEVSSGLLRAVLVSTIVVVALNVLLPVYAAYALRSFRYWAELGELDRMTKEDGTAKLRQLLTTRGGLSAQDFDDIFSLLAKRGEVEGPPAQRLVKAMMRAMILGRDGIFGLTPGRTIAYYCTQLFTRRAFREGSLTYSLDDDIRTIRPEHQADGTTPTNKEEIDGTRPVSGQADGQGVKPSAPSD
jgi:hypothetical protein